MRTLLLTLLTGLLLSAYASSAYAQQKQTLTIDVTGIKNSKGKVLVGIYNKKDNAFDIKYQFEGAITPTQKEKMTFRFELPSGNYAVGVFHDENDNGELDKNFLGIPKESYGFSGKATRPVFEDAIFRVDKPTKITIELR